MKTKGPLEIQQDELALSSIASHAVFPGREMLYVGEVAKVLKVTIQHVINLIEEYGDTGGKSGLMAVNIANKAGNKTPRNGWRIPVSAFDDFVARNKANAVS